MSFWDFTPSDKTDVLCDKPLHYGKIAEALRDPETGIIEYQADNIVLYGKEQALLVSVCSVPYQIVLQLFIVICDAFQSGSSNTR